MSCFWKGTNVDLVSCEVGVLLNR